MNIGTLVLMEEPETYSLYGLANTDSLVLLIAGAVLLLVMSIFLYKTIYLQWSVMVAGAALAVVSATISLSYSEIPNGYGLVGEGIYHFPIATTMVITTLLAILALAFIGRSFYVSKTSRSPD